MLIRGRASQKLKQLEMGRMGSEMSRECHFETVAWNVMNQVRLV